MPGMMPQLPEGVNYREYEEQRDDAMRLAVIKKAVPYIVRFRAAEPTAELFAYDMTGLITAARDLGKYSLMRARVSTFDGVGETAFGVNQNGIVFDPGLLPFDLDEVPYKAERGYFVGDADGHDNGERSVSHSEELEYDEAANLRQHLALTG